VVLTLCVQQLQATAIAVIVTPRFIVIATDSKAVDDRVAPQGETCKIRKANDLFYVPNKLVRHAASGYDLDQIIQDLRGHSVVDMAAKLKEIVIGPLQGALTYSRSEDRALFKDNFGSRQAMGVILVGFEKGYPAVVDLRFIIEDLSAAEIILRTEQHGCPGRDCPQGYALVLVPQELSAAFEAKHPRHWVGNSGTVAAKAEEFVIYAARQMQASVGPPFSVFVLNSNGVQWLKPGVCRP